MTKNVTVILHPILLMNISTTQRPTDDDVHRAAKELIVRYGIQVAIEDATLRADALARDGRWPEHSAAMRVLTAVERLAEDAQ
ncbi:conserved protein of unknown function [Magnetospirillum sp. XM-1]|uniref:hypothetical protein n=1 Tax=Magnetospirillum sp. XM-1 TaxID=1663591 RepID=UPI00073DC876|nr:hypothetical protein [Magnetospirillum sp. XM-1]CUW37162.1 conserved protein of unknown function [Magnetospirillum sp. XM-1]